MNTHGIKCGFGRFEGQLYTRIPVNYLLWMMNVSSRECDIAEAELKRRGTIKPEIDVSGHAIDRASLQCRKIWHETKNNGEGLHSWLVRVAQEAIKTNERDHEGRYFFLGMRFVFEEDGIWPVLKTVMRKGKKKNEQ